MRKIALISAILLMLPLLSGAKRPSAPAGFRWKEYPEVHCALQVPEGWHERFSSLGLTKVVIISPEEISESGFNTGFTMQSVHCRTKETWKEAMTKGGQLMKAARDAIDAPIVSKIDENEEMLYMVVEGVRKVPESPHPTKLYHVRNAVRVFKKDRMVYIYSFGALAEDWESEWAKGKVVFSAIEYVLPD